MATPLHVVTGSPPQVCIIFQISSIIPYVFIKSRTKWKIEIISSELFQYYV